MASICILSAGLGLALWKDPERLTDEATLEGLEDAEASGAVDGSSAFKNPTVVKLLILSTINAFGWMVSDGPEAIFMADHFGFEEKDLAAFFVVITGVMCIFTGVVPSIISRIGNTWTCVIGSP